LQSRYLTEDIPYALVLASSIGVATGVPTPVIDGLIAIGGAMLARDFRAEGRTLETLGLGGAGKEDLRHYAETGRFAS
jgi:opine dehydrogenase